MHGGEGGVLSYRQSVIAPSRYRGRSRLLESVRAAIGRKHYSIRTEQAYLHWTKRFILFHRKRHPADMGGAELTAFLNHLAMNGRVAESSVERAAT